MSIATSLLPLPSVTPLQIDSVTFAPAITSPASHNPLFLGGAGVRGLNIHGTFVIFTVIGIYLEANAVPSLSVKWKGKTPKELTESVPFFRDVVTGEFEKFIKVTMKRPLTGKEYSEKVATNCVAIWKSLGIYTQSEAVASDVNLGWKVLLTSRNESVGLRADPKCFTSKPNFLTLEECWTIFQRIVFPRENSTENTIDEEMEEMGKQMIKHCGGLSLAVKVLGGLLASQYSLHGWKRVYENIRSHIVGGTSFNARNISSVYHILYLSFEELPIYLKHCFLYLAHFPEDYALDVGNLSFLWAAEGIPRPRYYEGATIREVADGYMEELAKRNMIVSERDVNTSRFETCQLHDMMREVCLLKAEEENFVHIVDISNSTATSESPCKSRRLVIHSSGDTIDMKGCI